MRPLTNRERNALERFARLEIQFEELEHALRGVVEVKFAEDERRLNSVPAA